jgi:hypothetical protein
MSKNGKLLDISDRDWLSVGTGAVRDGDPCQIGDDIGTLHDFLCGKPTAIKEVRAAIVRIVNSGWDELGLGRTLITMLFDRNHRPDGSASAWTVDFKSTEGGAIKPLPRLQYSRGNTGCPRLR